MIKNIALALRRRKNWIPPWLRAAVLRRFSVLDARTAWWESKDPYLGEPDFWKGEKYPVVLGIAKEVWHRHWPYIAACRELGVSYQLIDLASNQWLDLIQQHQVRSLLVCPSVQLSIWKQMYDERVRTLTEEKEILVYPSCKEVWLYESKRRMHDWLWANGIDHAKTWVFYSRAEAEAFAALAPLPIVAKTNMGARASGVFIFRKRGDLLSYIRKCFGRGIVHSDGDARDPDWGVVLLQEYLADVAEWRLIRLGKSYFAHQKLKKGDFHSGSGRAGWMTPPPALLDFARFVTDKGGFTSMNMDIFETPSGKYLVNELQTMFGWVRPYQMLVEGRPGRFVYDQERKTWVFQEGIFCQNGGCNLRVEALLEKLGQKSLGWKTNLDSATVYD